MTTEQQELIDAIMEARKRLDDAEDSVHAGFADIAREQIRSAVRQLGYAVPDAAVEHRR